MRLHVHTSLQGGQTTTLADEAAHYVRNVLRLDPGDRLRVFDGSGTEFEAELLAEGRRGLAIRTLGAVEALPESPLAVHLGLGMSRGERMDWALQKATELGVAAVTPLQLERCTARLAAGREDNRTRHWRQVMASACEQCGRARVPVLGEACELGTWLERTDGMPGIVLHTRDATRLDADNRPSQLRVLIGPEGGLSDTELMLARRAGLVPVALGPRVLRAETAPVAALAILQYLWGDL